MPGKVNIKRQWWPARLALRQRFEQGAYRRRDRHGTAALALAIMQEAHATGRRLMRAATEARGLTVQQKQLMRYDPRTATFRYMVKSSADIRDRYGSASVVFDANAAQALRSFSTPASTLAARRSVVKSVVTGAPGGTLNFFFASLNSE